MTESRLSILIYHRVLDRFDYLRPDEPVREDFLWHMSLLSRYMNPLSLPEALLRLSEDRLPGRAVCVTFDDGYADNLHCALPVLERCNIPATIFVATDFVDGENMWNDRIVETLRYLRSDSLDLRSLGLSVYLTATKEQRYNCSMTLLSEIKYKPLKEREHLVSSIESLAQHKRETLMLSESNLRTLHARGVNIGAHTQSHPILSELSPEDSYHEIAGSKQWLETSLQCPVEHFAYPNGRLHDDYTDKQVKQVKQIGFKSALTTEYGAVVKNSDLFQLPRFTPWGNSRLLFLLRLLKSRYVLGLKKRRFP